jgi:hypothetical protein
MSTNTPCILIYNPISGHGHLDSWNALFVSCLLKSGWHVLALTPDAADLHARLENKGLAHSPGLKILDWDVLRRSFVEKVVGRLQRLFTKQPFQKSSDPEINYLSPLEFVQRVNKSLKRTSWKPDLVFNMYMDLYKTDQTSWEVFEAQSKFPWAGIRFVPKALPTEAYYRSASAFGMCFLDEQVCEKYKEILPDKAFSYLPDITETALPTSPSKLVQQIKNIAADRKIVFLGGTIGGSKNLYRWYELISRADANKWFFLQIGEVHENSLTEDDVSARNQILQNLPENLFIYPEYLQDEKQFNEIILLSDVLFAVYRDFKISSNMPGKAAAFNRPILVSDNYLMGARVVKYEMGCAVPQDDVSKMLGALTELVQPDRLQSLSKGFEAYRKDFSAEALRAKLDHFLWQALIKQKKPFTFIPLQSKRVQRGE